MVTLNSPSYNMFHKVGLKVALYGILLLIFSYLSALSSSRRIYRCDRYELLMCIRFTSISLFRNAGGYSSASLANPRTLLMASTVCLSVLKPHCGSARSPVRSSSSLRRPRSRCSYNFLLASNRHIALKKEGSP